MAANIKFNQTRIQDEAFPLDKMVALVRSGKVFRPIVDGRDVTHPGIEFIDAKTYAVTGLVREQAATAFLDDRIKSDLTSSAAFNKKVMVGMKGDRITFEVAAAGDYEQVAFLTFLHANMAAIPDDPAPTVEEEAGEAAEATAEAAAE